MADTTSILDLLGQGLFSVETERAFIQWCVVQTVRPAFAHALSTHNLIAEGRQIMTATTAEAFVPLAAKIGENARETMFRQLTEWIKRTTDYGKPRAAWDSAREATVWSLIYSQRLSDVAGQAEQYQRIDKQIRQTHASRLREMAMTK